MGTSSFSKQLLFVLALLLSPEVLAAGLFEVLPTDKSLEYLGIIFGGSVGAITLGGDANAMLSKMFERFNFIIVTLGVFILSYIGIAAAINTAREGEAMGKKFSLWVPLRAMLGMLLMVPSPGTGYSVVQMTVMWVVLNGIGAANTIWAVVLDQLGSGIKVVGKVEVPIENSKLAPIVQEVLKASTCMQVLNNVPNKLVQDYGRVKLMTSYGDIIPLTRDTTTTQISRNATINVGVETPANVPGNNVCGSFTVSTLIMKGDKNNSFNVNSLNARLAVKVNAVLAMFSVVEPATSELRVVKPLSADLDVSEPPLPEPGYLQQALDGYKAQIANIISGINLAVGGGTSPAESWERANDKAAYNADQITTFKRLGWIHAGSYYFSMSKSAGAQVDQDATTLNPSFTNIPNVVDEAGLKNNENSPPPTEGSSWWRGTQQLYTTLQNLNNRILLVRALKRSNEYYDNELKSLGSTNSLPALGSGKVSSGNGFVDQILGPISDGMRAPIIKIFQSDLVGKAEDPLISMGKYGWEIMLGGELSIFIAIVTAFVISMATSPASCMNPAAYAANQLLIQLFVVVFTFLALLWTLGATLGVYMPLVPYIVFTGTAVGWLIAVVEAIVAAPLIALAMVQPGGEEIGETKHALLILANLFLRPALMIFGFVIAGSFLRAILTMLNFGFARAVEESVIPTLFGIIPVLGIYAGFVVAIVNQAFSLIYELPNKVMRYMGAPAGSDYTPSAALKGAKEGADKGSEVASGAMKAAGGAAQGYMKAKLEKGKMDREDKLKEEKKFYSDTSGATMADANPLMGTGKDEGDAKLSAESKARAARLAALMSDEGDGGPSGGSASGSGSMAGASDAPVESGGGGAEAGATDTAGGGVEVTPEPGPETTGGGADVTQKPAETGISGLHEGDLTRLFDNTDETFGAEAPDAGLSQTQAEEPPPSLPAPDLEASQAPAEEDTGVPPPPAEEEEEPPAYPEEEVPPKDEVPPPPSDEND